MGVVIMNDRTIDVELERAIPAAVMDIFCGSMRAKVVHIS